MGRIIVSVTDPSIAGLTLHDALNDREDRSHVHNYTAVVTLNGSFPSASSSPPHTSPQRRTLLRMAAATRMEPRMERLRHLFDGSLLLRPHSYTSEPAGTSGGTSGLPFTQLLLCATSGAVNGSAPFGSVAYFDPSITECPANWIPFADAAGASHVTLNAPV